MKNDWKKIPLRKGTKVRILVNHPEKSELHKGDEISIEGVENECIRIIAGKDNDLWHLSIRTQGTNWEAVGTYDPAAPEDLVTALKVLYNQLSK